MIYFLPFLFILFIINGRQYCRHRLILNSKNISDFIYSALKSGVWIGWSEVYPADLFEIGLHSFIFVEVFGFSIGVGVGSKCSRL